LQPRIDNLEVVTSLLQAGAPIVCHPEIDSNVWDKSSLGVTMGKKHISIVEVLLKHGVNVNDVIGYDMDMFSPPQGP